MLASIVLAVVAFLGPIYKSTSKFSIRPGDDHVGGHREDVRII